MDAIRLMRAGWWKTLARLLSVAWLLIGLSSCGGSGGSNSNDKVPAPLDIVTALGQVPGVVSWREASSPVANARFFVIGFSQPADHHNPQGTRFEQTATLLLRDKNAPVVLAFTGYGISRVNPWEQEPTRLLRANQLMVEHRFFNTSTPNPVNWTYLDIWQSANDAHRLVQAFKPLLPGAWVNTGGSKGGMTAIFHRRFFPGDVNATVAYVAPIMQANDDARFAAFIETRGTLQQRDAIRAWQQAMLDRREEMKALLQAQASARGQTFRYLGLDKTFEFAVIEAAFTLWQYGDSSLAEAVPPASASASVLYQFLDRASFGVVDTWSDTTLEDLQAYYYQSATQLGYGFCPYAYLSGLKYPGEDTGVAYPPLGVSKEFDPRAMADIIAWLRQSASQMLFVYGENDPWTAAAVEIDSAAKARDNVRYDVLGGNHSASLSMLPVTQRNEAFALLSKWTGATITPSLAAAQASTFGRGERSGLRH